MWTRTTYVLALFTLVLFNTAQAEFSGGRDFVPEGQPERQKSIATVEGCQAKCAAAETCKAYAFSLRRRTCYAYTRVFMGGTPLTREMGVYSSGLSIRKRTGFVYGFKASSFPKRPVMTGTKEHPNP